MQTNMTFNTKTLRRCAVLYAFIWTTLFSQQNFNNTNADLVSDETGSAFTIYNQYLPLWAIQSRILTTAKLKHSITDEIEEL